MSTFSISPATPADLDFILSPDIEVVNNTGLVSDTSLRKEKSTQKSAVGGSLSNEPIVLGEWKPEPIDCDNCADFHISFWPNAELAEWQEQTLRQLSGAPLGEWDDELLKATPENPLLYSLVAANGSGKSAMILARWALFYIACKVNSKVVVTSETFAQLKNQTFRAISLAAEEINDFLHEKYFTITEVKVVCEKTRSTIYGFATDQPGRAEGYHPDIGGEMCVLIDEAKSITDEMFQAFSRFTGFSQWIEVSSPGSMDGHFYKRTKLAKLHANAKETQPLELGKIYHRKVTAFECPWITQSHIDGIRDLWTVNSLPYRSGILAEFTSLNDSAVIKQEKTIYPAPLSNDLGQPLRCGIDLSLGGDETVMIIVRGNEIVCKEVWHIDDSHRLVKVLTNKFSEFGLEAENINADGGGLGKVVIQMIRAEGWEIQSINNESAALYKKEFLNRGMEMYWKVMRLVEEQVLILPHDDSVLMHQLVTRQSVYRNGKLGLQSKAELSESPDRADAYVLAYASVNLPEVLSLWKGEKQRIATAGVIPVLSFPSVEEIERRMEARAEERKQKEDAQYRPELKMHRMIGQVQQARFKRFLAGPKRSLVYSR